MLETIWFNLTLELKVVVLEFNPVKTKQIRGGKTNLKFRQARLEPISHLSHLSEYTIKGLKLVIVTLTKQKIKIEGSLELVQSIRGMDPLKNTILVNLKLAKLTSI